MNDTGGFKDIILAAVYPLNVKQLENPSAVIERLVIGSYAPEAPPIAAGIPVACIGSCFAEEMSKSLKAQGKPVLPLLLSERWNTPFAVRYFLEYALDNRPFPNGFLPPHIEGNTIVTNTLRSAGAYIITLGLSLCWFELSTNRMVMDIQGGHSGKHIANALTTHTMRQMPVADCVAEIDAIVASIRRTSATAPIVFTLSPVPLRMSLTTYPPVASNTISKSTLRVAIHEVMERNLDNVFYWPSYEIVEWVGKNVELVWGQDGNDLRHLRPSFIDAIMQAFARFYFPSS